MFIDFKAIKALATLHQIADWLGLTVKNDRCQCPRNEGDVRELVLNADRQSWTCFGCKKNYPNERNSGDGIQLVAHVLQVDQKQAATHIQTRFHGYKAAPKGLPPEGLVYLQFDHPDVQELGLSPEKAEDLGIGFAPRGTMIRHVLFPLRDSKGFLLGYVGFPKGTKLKLPKNLL